MLIVASERCSRIIISTIVASEFLWKSLRNGAAVEQASRSQEFHMQTYRRLSVGFHAAGVLCLRTNPQILSILDSAISPSRGTKVPAVGTSGGEMEVSSVDYLAYIGLDWADREHAWCLQVVGHTDREKGLLPHTPEAVEQWA